MTARRDRMARVAKVAAETEEQARARWAEATRAVNQVDVQRESALDRAANLATLELPLAFRSHLTGAGARYLVSLADQKTELVIEAESRREELQEAVTKVKSLDRLIERLDRQAAEERERRAAAELQDLVAVRAAKTRAASRSRIHTGAADGRSAVEVPA
ncbi:MAG: hypothetical protein AAGA65_09785 [Actinomycetota bacterium]